MKKFLLQKVRLTYYFVFLLFAFMVMSLLIGEVEFDRPALTLFSVNSFLYGFYISPIINAQRARINELHKLIRVESAKLYEIALYSKRLEQDVHTKLLKELNEYAAAAYADHDKDGEKEFEDIMTLLINYKGDHKDPYKEIMKAAFAVQGSRSAINLLLSKRVFKNEWIVMVILFTITVSFIMLIKLPEHSLLQLIPPVLGAGLSMLVVILVKMSTLTHKRAKTIWDPLDNLVNTHFRKINNQD